MILYFNYLLENIQIKLLALLIFGLYSGPSTSATLDIGLTLRDTDIVLSLPLSEADLRGVKSL